MKVSLYILVVWFGTVSLLFANGFDRDALHADRLDFQNREIGGVTQSFAAGSFDISADDILISESAAPSTFDQDYAAGAVLPDNRRLILFADERNGSFSIFGQFLDYSGAISGSNFIIAESSTGADLVDPQIHTDTLGHTFVFYRDKSSGLIYGGRYDSLFVEDVSPHLINDTSGSSYAGPYDVAVYPDGRYVVVWEEYSLAGSTIEFRIYDEAGISVFGPQTVNSDGGSVSHWVPSVAVDPSGDILIGWEDYRNSRADIYIRLYNGAGSPLGSDFAVVPPPSNSFDQYAPEIAFSTVDKFIIGWLDRRSGQELYMQQYKTSSGLVGGNIRVSGPDSLVVNWNASFAVHQDSLLSAAWAAIGPDNEIQYQPFAIGLTLDGTPVTLNSETTGRRWEPMFFYDADDNFQAVWTELTSTHSDIQTNMFNSSGVGQLAQELQVNDDVIGAVSSSPVIASAAEWYKLVAFVDERNDAGDIYVQTVSNASIIAGSNQKVNQDIEIQLQNQPAIGGSIPARKALVAWVDSRDVLALSGQRIYGRYTDDVGTMPGDEFMISDSGATAVKKSPKVALLDDGSGLVVWIDSRMSPSQVYGQVLGSDGTLIGSNFQISSELTDTLITSVSLSKNSAGDFYVSWINQTIDGAEINGRVVDAGGTPQASYSWASSIINLSVGEGVVAVRANGNLLAGFTGAENPKKVFIAEFDTLGNEITAPTEISDAPLPYAEDPSISVSNNDYVSLSWTDKRNGKKQVYYQVLDDALQPVGVNSPASAVDLPYMVTPATHAIYGRAFYVWVDPRADGDNIYCGIVVYLPTDVDDGNNVIVPEAYSLAQNYPNPFNPSTEIQFVLPRNTDIKLAVYNMLGQHVKTLADGILSAGEHRVTWDATDERNNRVASGIYFYRLETSEYTALRKMILLK